MDQRAIPQKVLIDSSLGWYHSARQVHLSEFPKHCGGDKSALLPGLAYT